MSLKSLIAYTRWALLMPLIVPLIVPLIIVQSACLSVSEEDIIANLYRSQIRIIAETVLQE